MSALTLEPRVITDGMMRPEAFMARHPGVVSVSTLADGRVVSALTRRHYIRWDYSIGVYVVTVR